MPCIVSYASTPWCLLSLSARISLSVFVTVQERNSLGAVKAVTAAQLAMASDTVYRVSLDQAIEAMRLTAADMSVKYKETSLSVRPSRCSVRGSHRCTPLLCATRLPNILPLPTSAPVLTDRPFRSLLGFGGKFHSSARRLFPPQLCFGF